MFGPGALPRYDASTEREKEQLDMHSRRRFILGAMGAAAASAIAAACAPAQPTFTPVPPTAVPKHETRIITTLAAGAGFPDGFNSGEYWVAMHNEKKNIQPIPPEAFGKSSQNELAGLFYDYSLPGLVVEGKMWAMPIEWNALNLYYNIASFKEAGIEKPPATWDEVSQVA